MRTFLILGAALALTACGQAQDQAPETELSAAEIDAGSHEIGEAWIVNVNDSAASLASVYAPNAPAFLLECRHDSKQLKASADVNQVGAAAKAGPGQFSASGEMFDGAIALPETGAAPIVEITLPIDAKLLNAIQGATTTRIVVGDAFAESGVDSGENFEKFAQGCAALHNIALAAPAAGK
jgi:hypothetical protein